MSGDFSIIRNWVLTQASTVTRSRSMAAITASASKRSCTTVGAPSTDGVTCDVQMPKPNGAGIALRKTSSVVMSPASAASWWKYIHRFCGVQHALRHAGGAGRRVDQEEVVGPVGAPGDVALGRAADRPARPSSSTTTWCSSAHPAVRSTSTRSAVGRPRCSVERDQRVGAGEADEVADLVVAGPVPEPDDGEARPLRGDERDVDGDAVGEEDRHPRPSGEPGADQHAGERGRPLVVVGPGRAAAVGHDRIAGRSLTCPRRHRVADGGVAPPSGGAVLGGDSGIGRHRILLLRRVVVCRWTRGAPMTTTPTEAARVRSRVDHPIIDADGHFVELGPLLHDEVISYVEDAGGAALRERFLTTAASRSTRRRASPTGATRPCGDQWKAMPSWWGWQTAGRARPRHLAPPGAALRAARRARHRLHDPLPVDGARVLRGRPTRSCRRCSAAPSTATTPASSSRTATAARWAR